MRQKYNQIKRKCIISNKTFFESIIIQLNELCHFVTKKKSWLGPEKKFQTIVTVLAKFAIGKKFAITHYYKWVKILSE